MCVCVCVCHSKMCVLNNHRDLVFSAVHARPSITVASEEVTVRMVKMCQDVYVPLCCWADFHSEYYMSLWTLKKLRSIGSKVTQRITIQVARVNSSSFHHFP
ncbi:hypothetical protein DPEC_G00334270 [Dallia pectoralis]|uniref:Uncharacterized protein n=1 Tax=Dallia pectoralis TaxID=75939 RepID=A0ACC2F6N5_DALPE|nr:hypothetical protein DPEC_G00334270 [Dallia pectoralis]